MGRFHRARATWRLARCVLQRAKEASEHRALLADLLGQLLQTARRPEFTLIAHVAQTTQPPGLVQERDHAQVTAEEIGQAAATRVAGVVRFTERMPRPAFPASSGPS